MADADTAARRGAAGARPPDASPGRSGSRRSASCCGWCRCSSLLADAGPGDVFSQIAVFFTKMAVVTFGGAYAVLAYVAQQAVETYGWLRPGEMLDGLGMAETTPGPLIMVVQFVGFMAAFRDPGALPPLLAGDAGRAADHLGHLRALLPVDLPRRALHRDPARQQGADGGAGGDHRRGRRRDPEPRGLVRPAHAVRASAPGARPGPDASTCRSSASLDLPALVLTLAALLAVFRFKAGMIPTLLPAPPRASCCISRSASSDGSTPHLSRARSERSHVMRNRMRSRFRGCW